MDLRRRCNRGPEKKVQHELRKGCNRDLRESATVALDERCNRGLRRRCKRGEEGATVDLRPWTLQTREEGATVDLRRRCRLEGATVALDEKWPQKKVQPWTLEKVRPLP